jgi:hypothetical protein
MVTDGGVTLTGSMMNWTRGPAANSENLNLVSSPDFAAAYLSIGGTPQQCPFDMSGAGTGAGSHREKRASVRADE